MQMSSASLEESLMATKSCLRVRILNIALKTDLSSSKAAIISNNSKLDTNYNEQLSKVMSHGFREHYKSSLLKLFGGQSAIRMTLLDLCEEQNVSVDNNTSQQKDKRVNGDKYDNIQDELVRASLSDVDQIIEGLEKRKEASDAASGSHSLSKSVQLPLSSCPAAAVLPIISRSLSLDANEEESQSLAIQVEIIQSNNQERLDDKRKSELEAASDIGVGGRGGTNYVSSSGTLKLSKAAVDLLKVL